MNKLIKTALFVLIIFSLFLIPACTTNTGNEGTETGNGTDTGYANNGITGTNYYTDKSGITGTATPGNKMTTTNTGRYNLYFGDQGYKNLVTEQRNFTNTAWNATDNLEDMANEALNSLITGPTTNTNYAVLPNNTKINYVKQESDGVLHVDFSDGFIDGYNDLGTTENMTVYSIVNTLTDLPSVDKVRLTINDKPFKITNTTYNNDLVRDNTLFNR